MGKFRTNLKQPTDGTRICTKCRTQKPVAEFSPNGESGHKSRCKPCSSQAQKARHKANPHIKWQWRIKDTYGITLEQKAQMLVDQGGCCAICQSQDSGGKPWAVDHDHACCPGEKSCGKCIRGILCWRCNSMLGLAGDKPATLSRAITYLENNSPRSEVA